MNSVWVHSIVVAFTGLSLFGCSGNESEALPSGDVTRGMGLVETGQCRSCHGPDLSGSAEPLPNSMVYSSNITPDDETGIGLWTDTELDELLRLGKDNSGEAVCPPMPVYDMLSDQQVADIIAYLRSVPPVHRQVDQSSCR